VVGWQASGSEGFRWMSMNLFTIASTDQSVFYLGQIFGNIGGLLSTNDAPILLGLMFKVLNTAALSVGAMIVVYTTVAGLLSTASEGEFLGKKWSGMWVPIRTVLGIVGLFPSSGGYCAIQIIIMWLILQGVGFADTLWTAVLQLIDQEGSVYATTTFPDVAGATQQPFKNLFTGLVCYETLARNQDVANSPAPYLCKSQPGDARCGVVLPVFEPGTPFNLGDTCGGTLTVCNSSSTDGACKDPHSVDCALCKGQLQALSDIIPTFAAVANTFVQMDYDYQQFFYTSDSKTTSDKVPQWIQDFCTSKDIQGKCCVGAAEYNESMRAADLKRRTASRNRQDPFYRAPVNNNETIPDTVDPVAKCSYGLFGEDYFPSGSGNNSGPGTVNLTVLKDIYMPGIKSYTNNVDFIKAAATQYQAVMNGAYLTFLATLPPSATKAAWNQEAQKNGWILAGMYYMQITQKSANQLPSTKNLPQLNFPMVKNPDTGQSDIKLYRNNINAMPSLFRYINENNSGDSDLAVSTASEINEASWTSMNSMVSSFMHDISGPPGKLAENPLYKISLWGYNMMIVVQFLFALTTVLVAVAAAVMATNFLVVGTGMTSPPWDEAFKAIWNFTSPFLILALSGLFSIGAVLGIYLPLIPYTIFLMGAIGWLMATIEAMVAGPIIALGILSPSGQHELLGKSEPAVMIIFNLILRPALMVFGMMASMLLAVVVVTMINQGFAKVAFNIIQAPGLVESIFFMMAYTSLLVTALNKVFTLIHVIPEKVLTYIGGQAISQGEGEGLQGMKQAMEGGASGISGGAKEAGAAPAAGISKVGQDDAHAKSDTAGAGATARANQKAGVSAPDAPAGPAPEEPTRAKGGYYGKDNK